MNPDFDPNSKIEEQLKADGELLRDVAEGKSPTEIGLGVDLGTTTPPVPAEEVPQPTAADLHAADLFAKEHAEVMGQMGEVIEADQPADQPAPVDFPQAAQPADVELPAAPPSSPPAAVEAPEPPVALPADIEAPDVRADEKFEARAEHAEVMGEMGKVVSQENQPAADDDETKTPAQRVEERAYKRSQERKARLGKPHDKHALQSEHGEAFVALGNVVREANEPDEAPQPVQMAQPEAERLAFPGQEQSNEVGKAIQSFMDEDREWRALVVRLFRVAAGEIRQQRLELDRILGHLERSRL
jgi:hypothetical protein